MAKMVMLSVDCYIINGVFGGGLLRGVCWRISWIVLGEIVPEGVVVMMPDSLVLWIRWWRHGNYCNIGGSASETMKMTVSVMKEIKKGIESIFYVY